MSIGHGPVSSLPVASTRHIAGAAPTFTVFQNGNKSVTPVIAAVAIGAAFLAPNLLFSTLAPSELAQRPPLYQAKKEASRVAVDTSQGTNRLLFPMTGAANNVIGEQSFESAPQAPRIGAETSQGRLVRFSLPGAQRTDSAPQSLGIGVESSRGVLARFSLPGAQHLDGAKTTAQVYAETSQGFLAVVPQVFTLVGAQQTDSAASLVRVNAETSKGVLAIVPDVFTLIGKASFEYQPRQIQVGLETSKGVLAQAQFALPFSKQQIESAPIQSVQIGDESSIGSFSFLPFVDVPPVVVVPDFSGGWPVPRVREVRTVRDVPVETVEQIKKVARRDYSKLKELDEKARAKRIKDELDQEFRTKQQKLYMLVYLEVLQLELMKIQLEEEEAMFLMIVASEL